mmetsp:Transcript_23331/g.27453  ORF Transcript_23331/g.27453 Transcript_23331/m.27453 type:complete len:1160 (+) Transcript_23331:132-3611(+)
MKKRAILFSLTEDELNQKRLKNSPKNKPEIIYSKEWQGYQDDIRIVWVLHRDTLEVYSVWENGHPIPKINFTTTLHPSDAKNVGFFLKNPPWRTKNNQRRNNFILNKYNLNQIPVYRRMVSQNLSKPEIKIFECIGWMDIGEEYIIVVERPQIQHPEQKQHIPVSSIVPINAQFIQQKRNNEGVEGLFEENNNSYIKFSTFLSKETSLITKLVFAQGTTITPLVTEMIQCLFSPFIPITELTPKSPQINSSFDNHFPDFLPSSISTDTETANNNNNDILKSLNGLVLSSCDSITPLILRMLLRSSSSNLSGMGPSEDIYSSTTSATTTSSSSSSSQISFEDPNKLSPLHPVLPITMMTDMPFLAMITSLDLSFSNLSDDCCRPLAAALLFSQISLHTLILSGNSFGVEGARFLAIGFEANDSLHYLDLSGNHFYEGIDELSKSLSNHPCLEILLLDGCKIGVRGGLALATLLLLPGKCPITCLSLTNNQIGSDGYAAIQSAISAVTNKISRDDEEDNLITHPTSKMKKLTSTLPTSPECASLSMLTQNQQQLSFLSSGAKSPTKSSLKSGGRDGGDDDDGKKYRGVKKLNVAFNGISKLSIPRSVIDGLELSPARSIQHLNLSNNSLNDMGVVSLSETLHCLPGLTSLDLGYNLLGIKGLYPLLAVLPFLKVSSLDLSGNPLDTACMWALAFTLGNDQYMKKLNLSGTSLCGRDAVAGHFAVALLSNPLTKLEELSGPDLSVALKNFGIDQNMFLSNYRTKSNSNEELSDTVFDVSDNSNSTMEQAITSGSSGRRGTDSGGDKVRNKDVIRWIKEFKEASDEHSKTILNEEKKQQKIHFKDNFNSTLLRKRKLSKNQNKSSSSSSSHKSSQSHYKNKNDEKKFVDNHIENEIISSSSSSSSFRHISRGANEKNQSASSTESIDSPTEYDEPLSPPPPLDDDDDDSVDSTRIPSLFNVTHQNVTSNQQQQQQQTNNPLNITSPLARKSTAPSAMNKGRGGSNLRSRSSFIGVEGNANTPGGGLGGGGANMPGTLRSTGSVFSPNTPSHSSSSNKNSLIGVSSVGRNGRTQRRPQPNGRTPNPLRPGTTPSRGGSGGGSSGESLGRMSASVDRPPSSSSSSQPINRNLSANKHAPRQPPLPSTSKTSKQSSGIEPNFEISL